MLRYILALAAVLVVAASLASRLSEVHAGKAKTADKAFKDMDAYVRGRVVQPSGQSGPEKPRTPPINRR
jgi:hypothetical protein